MRIRSLNFSLSLLLFAGCIVASSANTARAGDKICATRAKVLAHLSSNYNEAPVAIGMANNGGVIEVTRSRDHQTFTIIITMPDGMTCMIAAGNEWRDLPVLAHDASL